MKTVQICLPYFKQGCDLDFCIGNTDSYVEALYEHAAMLLSAIEKLNGIHEVLCNSIKSDDEINIQADTHWISIDCEDELAQTLVDKGLAEFIEFDDEEDA